MVHPESLNDALREALEDEYREGKEDSSEENDTVEITMDSLPDNIEGSEEDKKKMGVIKECVEEITHEDHISDVVAEKVKENKLCYCQFEIYDEVNAVLEQQQ